MYTIRPVSPTDAAALRALRIEALTNHPAAFAADPAITAAESVERWAERIHDYTHGSEGTVFVADTSTGLAGMCGVGREHWPKTRHSAYIWGVYLRPELRGSGAAVELLAACEDWARQNGITILKLGVAVNNAAAVRAYARAGYTVYGVDPRALLVDGDYIDELMMSKVIRD